MKTGSSRRPAPRPGLRVDMARRVRSWAPTAAEIRRWARAALGKRGSGREISVQVVGSGESRRLNARYRRRDKPTNVLSFPSAPLPQVLPQPLGDLVICPQVLRSEALAQGKPLRAHWAHLVVHGSLHLIGYDHEREQDARRMERREIAVLKRLGFGNPYRVA
jgi:probable rRNA maturation factor